MQHNIQLLESCQFLEYPWYKCSEGDPYSLLLELSSRRVVLILLWSRSGLPSLYLFSDILCLSSDSYFAKEAWMSSNFVLLFCLSNVCFIIWDLSEGYRTLDRFLWELFSGFWREPRIGEANFIIEVLLSFAGRCSLNLIGAYFSSFSESINFSILFSFLRSELLSTLINPCEI